MHTDAPALLEPAPRRHVHTEDGAAAVLVISGTCCCRCRCCWHVVLLVAGVVKGALIVRHCWVWLHGWLWDCCKGCVVVLLLLVLQVRVRAAGSLQKRLRWCGSWGFRFLTGCVGGRTQAVEQESKQHAVQKRANTPGPDGCGCGRQKAPPLRCRLQGLRSSKPRSASDPIDPAIF